MVVREKKLPHVVRTDSSSPSSCLHHLIPPLQQPLRYLIPFPASSQDNPPPQFHSRAESGQLTSLFILHNGFPERRKEIGKFLLDCPPGEVNDVFNGMYTNVFEPSLIGNDDGLKYFDHIN